MSAHPPPVPPDQRSPHGGAQPREGAIDHATPPQDPSLAEQGRQGNTKQNTTNKGFQQDR